MRNLKKPGLVAALAAAAMACLGAAPAPATTMDGGAFTLTSSNLTWTFHGGVTVSCSASSITGTTPAGSATTLSTPVTLSYGGCSLFGTTMSVTPSEGCHTAATPPRLDVMQNQVVAPQASVQITLPVGCNLDLAIPASGPGCTMVITGGQSIGNGTSGAGGIGWTNLAPASVADFNGASIPDLHSNGGSALCPTAGTHSATLFGTYVSTGATNVTVTP